MTKLFTILLFLLVPGSAAAQQDVEFEATEGTVITDRVVERIDPLPPVQPTEELDSETSGSLAMAERLATEEPERSIEIVLALLLSHDPFTRQQREAIAREAAPILRKAASHLRESSPERAAFASDAAWTVAGRQPNPEHAELLMTLAADRVDSNEPEALWLARRALQADPNNREAAVLDRKLSRNRLLAVGWATLFAGVGGLIVGAVLAGSANSVTAELTDGQVRSRAELDDMIARRESLGRASVFGYVGGAFLMVGSGVVWGIGQRRYKPTSPEFLPAVRY